MQVGKSKFSNPQEITNFARKEMDKCHFGNIVIYFKKHQYYIKKRLSWNLLYSPQFLR